MALGLLFSTKVQPPGGGVSAEKAGRGLQRGLADLDRSAPGCAAFSRCTARIECEFIIFGVQG